jgi:hypothetical protein
MTDSKRLRILKALSTQLSTITVVNGYQHDIANVFRGRTVFGDSDRVPLISILEYPRPDFKNIEAGYIGARKKVDDWDILLQGFVKDDKDNPTDPAHLLLADVKKCLSLVTKSTESAYLLGGLLTDIANDGGIVRPPDDLSYKAHFYLRVVLKFVEREDDPYA